jgi:hypothetical protein
MNDKGSIDWGKKLKTAIMIIMTHIDHENIYYKHKQYGE